MEKALVLYPEKCTGCHSCEMVCSLVHEGQCSLKLSRIVIMKRDGGGTEENIPVVCLHCEDPMCVDACIQEAIWRSEKTGALLVREDLCIGCEACKEVCAWGGVLLHNIKGCAMMCDLCDGDPECVHSCLYGALAYLPVEGDGR